MRLSWNEIRTRAAQRVQRLDNIAGFIDLFWPGVLLVEQKSADAT